MLCVAIMLDRFIERPIFTNMLLLSNDKSLKNIDAAKLQKIDSQN